MTLDELRALLAAATPGRWSYDDGITDDEPSPPERGKCPCIMTQGGKLVADPYGAEEDDDARQSDAVPSLAEMDANGKAIVALRNNAEALLAVIEAALVARTNCQDTCGSVLVDGNPDNYPCSCGMAALRDALAPFRTPEAT